MNFIAEPYREVIIIGLIFLVPLIIAFIFAMKGSKAQDAKAKHTDTPHTLSLSSQKPLSGIPFIKRWGKFSRKTKSIIIMCIVVNVYIGLIILLYHIFSPEIEHLLSKYLYKSLPKPHTSSNTSTHTPSTSPNNNNTHHNTQDIQDDDNPPLFS